MLQQQHQMLSAVTHTLTELLKKRMANPPGTIQSLPPDVQVKDPPGPKRLNLFLYRVVENPFLKNHDAGASAGSFGRPPLSLDLHFLMTAYGGSDEDSKGAQEILGDAMAVFHDHAIVRASDPAYADVRDPLLDDAFEHVRIGLEPITTEDLTKVWTSLTVPYRLSVAYVVTVAQIKSRTPRKAAPLVRGGDRDSRPLSGHDGTPAAELARMEGRRLQVTAFEPPVLESVMVLRPGDLDDAPPHVAYAAIGDRLVLRGRNLGRPQAEGGQPAFVQVGPLRLAVPPATHAPNRIVMPLPDDPALQAGPCSVHVAVEQGSGRLLTTNRRPVLVIPFVESAWKTTAQVPDEDNPAPPGQPQPQKTVDAVGVRGTRLFRPGVECSTILSAPGGATIQVPGERYLEWQPGGAGQPQEILVPLPAGVDAAGMGVRVLVDGHENLPRPGLEVAP
ncbi:MAG: hypothetical protein QOD77_270 [Thermoplasmata archaeon]|jgi:hypothetical protein|nr:hypothetical protein [Thermoplasmata archaeon]